ATVSRRSRTSETIHRGTPRLGLRSFRPVAPGGTAGRGLRVSGDLLGGDRPARPGRGTLVPVAGGEGHPHLEAERLAAARDNQPIARLSAHPCAAEPSGVGAEWSVVDGYAIEGRTIAVSVRPGIGRLDRHPEDVADALAVFVGAHTGKGIADRLRLDIGQDLTCPDCLARRQAGEGQIEGVAFTCAQVHRA